MATDTGHPSDTDISQQLEQVQSLSTCRLGILSVYDLHGVLGLFKATCALSARHYPHTYDVTEVLNNAHNPAVFREVNISTLNLQMYSCLDD